MWEYTSRLRHQGISFVSGGTTGSTLETLPHKEAKSTEHEHGVGDLTQDSDDALEREAEIAEGDDDDEEGSYEDDEILSEPEPDSLRTVVNPPPSNNLSNLHLSHDPVHSITGGDENRNMSLPALTERPSRVTSHQSPTRTTNERKPLPSVRRLSPTPASASLARGPSPAIHRRSPSPTLSNSSDEIVVFKGRNGPKPIAQVERNPGTNIVETALGPSVVGPSVAPKIMQDQHGVHSSRAEGADLERPVAFRPAAHSHHSHEGRAIGTATSLKQANHDSDAAPQGQEELNAEGVITDLLRNHRGLDAEGNGPPAEAIAQPRKRRGRRSKRKERGRRSSTNEVLDEGSDIPEDVLDDYIANMKANGELKEQISADESSAQPNFLATPAGDSEWGRTELEDFENLSTSQEFCEIVAKILARRERRSGLQYLVVWEGHTADEARWIHHEVLVERHGANTHIAAFEEKRQLQLWNEAQAAAVPGSDSEDSEKERHIRIWNESKEVEFGASFADNHHDKVIVGPGSSSEEELKDEHDAANDSQGIDESDVDDDDYDTDDLPFSDEEDLIRRRQERMTDEHIARLLQRQEELGIDGDELVLFDGEEDDIEDNLDPLSNNLLETKGVAHRTRRGKRRARGRETEPHMEGALEDALSGDDYGHFDIMDWHRGSLSSKKRHAADIANLQISDSELERQLEGAWAADKDKKKFKKMEREELRAEGLLGSGKRNGSLTSRKSGPLSVEQFEDELENFLGGDRKQLALPPMDKKLRKMVHEIGNKFGLKTKSKGDGDNRFPVLYKTGRTKRFDAELFDTLESRFSRRFGLGGGSRRGKVPKAFVSKQGHSIADGQLVGAGAKEIGTENKGRQLLEKMGWSKGVGLGTLDNKGILMPIDHVMKKTRAGLG